MLSDLSNIFELYQDAIQGLMSDLETGSHHLNNAAAEKFNKTYPAFREAFDKLGAALAQAECCGNPLRGCEDCPPPKKLTFQEWYKENWDWSLPIHYEDLQDIWQAAQENK